MKLECSGVHVCRFDRKLELYERSLRWNPVPRTSRSRQRGSLWNNARRNPKSLRAQGPRQKFEAQGDLTGTPLHRWNSNKPQKSQQTPGRWQGSADSGKPSSCSASVLLGRLSDQGQCLALSCIVIWDFKPSPQSGTNVIFQALSNQGTIQGSVLDSFSCLGLADNYNLGTWGRPYKAGSCRNAIEAEHSNWTVKDRYIRY